MARIEPISGSEYVRINDVASSPLGEGLAMQATITVGASAYSIAPAAAPSTEYGAWKYLKVINLHATAVLYVAINEDPVAAPAATPGVAGDWEAGYPIQPLGAELIPIVGTITSIRLLSDTATTPVVLCLTA